MRFNVRHVAILLSPLSALLAGCGAPGLPATATVTLIDRKCEIIETIKQEVRDPRGNVVKLEAQQTNNRTGECKSVDEWEEVRKKRAKDIQGTATVHVDYQAPQDGRSHSGTLIFTGRDDEFYALNAGDTIAIIVAPGDPAKIRKA